MPDRSNDEPGNIAWDNAGPQIKIPSMPHFGKDFMPQTQAEATACAVKDQAAFDQLGPLTRKAMTESPVRFSAAMMLMMIRQQMAGMAPTSPRVDAMVADRIRQAGPAIVEQIRVADAASLEKVDPRDAIKRIVDRAMQPRQRVA